MGEWGVPGRHAFRTEWRLRLRAMRAGDGAVMSHSSTGEDADTNGNGRRNPNEPDHNLYVCIDGCLALRNHLAVRDVCRRDEEARERYAECKVALAEREFRDVNEYTDAKNGVLRWILEKAGLETKEVDEIQEVNEVEKK